MTVNDWQRFCESRCADEALGFSLDLSRVRWSSADLDRLQAPMARAFQAMAALEAGSIANPDEQRMVGHYWLRAPELAPSADLRASIEQTKADVLSFADAVHRGAIVGESGQRFRHVLHVGIGGSALGPQFVAEALSEVAAPQSTAQAWPQLHFIDNTDPDGIARILAALDGLLGQTLVVVVSKSGGTPETRNGMLEIQAAFQRQGVPFAPHAVAVTQSGSALSKTAEQQGWLKTFPMWDWVGGRTSVLSAVGLVPAALQGLPVEDLLAGAAAMDRLTRRTALRDNPAALLAAVWHHVGQGRGLKDMVILPYKDRLALFSKYLQQLVMESLGKELDRQGRVVNQGLAVYGNKGSTDQHAYVQQLREGLPNFFATFIRVLTDQPLGSTSPVLEVDPGLTTGDYLHGFWMGTREALYEKHRESITITVNAVDGRTVGALIALYERAVGLYAELIDINAYHQPGVEAGKKAAAAVLALQTNIMQQLRSSSQAHTAAEIAQVIGQPDHAESVYLLLEHLAANPGRGVRYTQRGTPDQCRYAAE
jgi:glucose-6-phosphate isomerase